MNFSFRSICPLTTSPTLFQLTHLLNGCSHTHPAPDAGSGRSGGPYCSAADRRQGTSRHLSFSPYAWKLQPSCWRSEWPLNAFYKAHTLDLEWTEFKLYHKLQIWKMFCVWKVYKWKSKNKERINEKLHKCTYWFFCIWSEKQLERLLTELQVL